MMALFIPESERAEPARPDVTYITTWQDGRSEAEILASNLENQKRKDEAAAAAALRAERRKEAARTLARASGFDPDELEKQFGDDEPAENAGSAPAADAAKPNTAAGE
jgi:hypothetical protein